MAAKLLRTATWWIDAGFTVISQGLSLGAGTLLLLIPLKAQVAALTTIMT